VGSQTSFPFLATEQPGGKPRRPRPLRRGDPDATVSIPRRGDPDAGRAALELRLAGLLGEPVALSMTEKRHTMISSRRPRRGMRVRLHHMFVDADVAAVRALVRRLTRTDRRASAWLR